MIKRFFVENGLTSDNLSYR